jgi:alpha-L-arabinofuranosidase
MPYFLKTTSFGLMITVFLLFMLTGCNFLNQDKSDAVIEIDLTKPGKALRQNLYGALIENLNRSTETKSNPESGSLKTALNLAAKMIAMENNTDSVKMISDTSALLKLSDLKANRGMFANNGKQFFYTPAFYALKMFSENRPDQLMPVKVSLNGEVSSGKGISTTAGIHEKAGLVIIKMVNSFNTPKHCRIVLNYKQQIKYKGEVIVMTSGNIMDRNSFKEPEKVVPMTKEVNGLRNTFNYECPANAIVIIHIRYKKGINGFVNCC